jgi:hypothetical protein
VEVNFTVHYRFSRSFEPSRHRFREYCDEFEIVPPLSDASPIGKPEGNETVPGGADGTDLLFHRIPELKERDSSQLCTSILSQRGKHEASKLHVHAVRYGRLPAQARGKTDSPFYECSDEGENAELCFRVYFVPLAMVS